MKNIIHCNISRTRICVDSNTTFDEIASFSRLDVDIMVTDFLADHADDYADDPLVLDGELVYDDDCGEYVQPCHDSVTAYLLVPHADGMITIEYDGTR